MSISLLGYTAWTVGVQQPAADRCGGMPHRLRMIYLCGEHSLVSVQIHGLSRCSCRSDSASNADRSKPITMQYFKPISDALYASNHSAAAAGAVFQFLSKNKHFVRPFDSQFGSVSIINVNLWSKLVFVVVIRASIVLYSFKNELVSNFAIHFCVTGREWSNLIT